MKKLLSLVLLVCFTCMVSCSKPIYDNSTKCEPYGFMNMHKKKENIKYRVNIGDVVWSIILIETIIAPVLILGLDVMEPVVVKHN